MAKQKCTVRELIQIIESRLEKPALIEIQPDPNIGWRPHVVTASIDLVRAQMQADAIADELRKGVELV